MRELIKEKFKEKFPLQFELCKDEPFYFNLSDHSCTVRYPQLGAFYTFKYNGEKDYSLTVSPNRPVNRSNKK